MPAHSLNAAQLEQAAREYCRLAGLDPNESVRRPAGELDVLSCVPRWRVVAEDIKKHLLMNLAIASVMTAA